MVAGGDMHTTDIDLGEGERGGEEGQVGVGGKVRIFLRVPEKHDLHRQNP